MKHFLSGIFAAASIAAFAFAGQAAAETKIVYADYLSPNHPTNLALERFFERIKNDTHGSVQWEAHFASSLLGAKDTPAGVRDGIADAGYFVGVYIPSEMPVDNYLGEFSMMNDDAVAMTGVVNDLVLLHCAECAEEYHKGFNTQFLGTYALTPYLFQCKQQVHSLADFKGLRIRGFSAWTGMIKQLSATPISISANEMYEALSRGIIDCATHTITNQKTRSLGEVAHNVILDSLGGFVGGSTINLRLSKWDALTADERTAILKNVPQLITESLFAYIDQDTSARKEMEAKGNKFYHLDSDAGAVIKKYREDYVAKDAVEKGTAHGIEHAQQIADEVRALRSKWDKLLEENGRDPATFQKLLWQEVYSKVSVN